MKLTAIQKIVDLAAKEHGIAPLTASVAFDVQKAYAIDQRQGSGRLRLLCVTQEFLEDAINPDRAITDLLNESIRLNRKLLANASDDSAVMCCDVECDTPYCPWCGKHQESRVFNKCGTCGKDVEIDNSETRSNRKYCSNACKLKAYRKRIKQNEIGATA